MSLLPRFKPARAATPVLAGDKKAAPSQRLFAKPQDKWDRSDLIIGAMGLALALTCAMFPWYIFFNQEKFGVREFVFDGKGTAGKTVAANHQPMPIGQPFKADDVPTLELDFFPTATVNPRNEPRPAPESEQPYPGDRLRFKLIHVANGRAMIRDSDGLWIVRKGSPLPDASKVVSIEQRDGAWVLVTSRDDVMTLNH